MAEDDTLNRVDEDDETPHIAVPSHDPLPLPPEISFTRPGQRQVTPGNSRQKDVPHEKNVPHDGLGSGALKLGSGLAAGTTFAASIIAGFLIGQWIDHRWNHSGGMPWGTLIFGLAGVAAGFLNLFRVISATDRKPDKKSDKK